MHFVSIESEKVELSHNFVCEDREIQRKYSDSPIDPAILVKSSLRRGKNVAKVIQIKPFRLKECEMSFLLHLNEDFDDDLLLDALDLIDCI